MTLQLPEALSAWRSELSMFPIDLAIDLGGLVRRLSSAIGSPAAARHRGEDPDGYDGIMRSGPYDRMLHSEWLYAEELPEEFLRRTVMREQLFFRLARRSPLDELFSVALFDAGPTQLGAARILHLALLIVLARRCAERDGRFRWGVLQQHPRRIHDRLDIDGARSLLSLRSVSEVTDSDLDDWSDLLPHGDQRHRETWLIGGDRLAGLVERHAQISKVARDYREAARVVIRQPLDHRDRSLQVEIRKARGQQQKLTLQLPTEQVAIRLIRDPFETLATAPAVTRGGSPVPSEMLFAANGTRLIGRTPRGGLVVHYLPHKWVKTYPVINHEPVIAAGWGRRKGGVSIATVASPQFLRMGRIHRQGETTLISPAAPFAWDRHFGAVPLMPAISTSLTSSLRNDYLFLDRFGGCWVTNRGEGLAMRIGSGVRAMVMHGHHPHLAQLHGDEWTIVRIEGDTPRVIDRHTGNGPSAFFGTPPDQIDRNLLAALQETESRWLVVSHHGVRINTCPDDARVIGITSTQLTRGPALVTAEKYAISFIHATHYSTLVKTTAPIESACVNSNGPHVAYVAGDELFVRSLERDALLYRAKVTR